LYSPHPTAWLAAGKRCLAHLLMLACAGCAHGLGALRQPPASFAVATAPPTGSMIYVARTDSALLVVDLGWVGAEAGLRRALARLGARPDEVTDVFLTHSHRDHIGAWPLVRAARFHMAGDEVPLFTAAREHQDLPSRSGALLFGDAGPWPGEVDVRPFTQDTVFALGRDTVHAFLLPGHTRGSAAYLFRRTLFVGDAFAWNRLTGLRRPARLFSADRRQSRASLAGVVDRASALGLDRICNAHAKCFPADSALLARLRR
jgi:glyoxylase-like metal-dependent hydrolase (beta-lactamase superfamily II)